MPSAPAGAWWCAQFPTSKRVSDLAGSFRLGVMAFIQELNDVHRCEVEIAATWRPSERAWLMHWAWKIAHSEAPIVPPYRADIPIEWTEAGALAMCVKYGLKYEPSLTSRHIEGRAIDMSIHGWTGTLADLYKLGAHYGVIKLVKDPPHWSDDGR